MIDLEYMELSKALMDMGLNEKEAQVYLALLPFDKATAYLIAQRSGLKKPTTYVILDNLVNKGFALKIPQADRHYFVAKKPRECFATARSKLSNAANALPQLEAIQKKSEEKVNVSYFEGIDGMKEMYRRAFEEVGGDEITGFFGHGRNAPPELLKLFGYARDEMTKRDISAKGITPKDESNQEVIKSLGKNFAQVKPVPLDKYDSNISIEAHKNFTHIMSFRHLQGIIIENKDIADAIRQITKLAMENVK